MPSTKNSTAHQKVRLLATLASLNSGHSSNLHACCVGVKSSSRPNLVPTRQGHPRSMAWRSSLIANLNSTAPRCVLTTGAHTCHRGGSQHNHRPLLRGDNDLSAQPHLALQQYYVELLHQLLLDLTLLGFKAHEVQVELALLLFGCIGQGLHSLADHLTHVLGHHRGPLGLFHTFSFGCDNRNHLALHQLVDCKVTNGHERCNVLDGRLHFGQLHVNR